MAILDGVLHTASLSHSHTFECRLLNTNYLNLNGARSVESIEGAMHVITNTSQFEGWRRVEDGDVLIVVVTVGLFLLLLG